MAEKRRQQGFINTPFKTMLDPTILDPDCLHCKRPIRKAIFGHGWMHPECEKACSPWIHTTVDQKGQRLPGNWPRRQGKRPDWDPLYTEASPDSDELFLVRGSTLLSEVAECPRGPVAE